jgi:3-isopropylmalate dehydrogenase
VTDTLRLLVLPGDGIGPEIVQVAADLLQRLDRRMALGLEFVRRDIGLASLAHSGSTLPDEVDALAREADGVILGPCDTYGYPPPDKGGVNPSAALRKRLDLYANIRPSKVREGVPRLADAVDLVVVRENTEGFYADRNMFMGSGEFMPTPDVALAVRKITAEASRRVARAACELAMRRRRHLTIVTKANVLKLTDGLFRREAEAVAASFPDLTVDHVLVDAMATALVRQPAAFDVIVTTNMFGDILSNLAAEMTGGLGLAGSLNAGDGHAVAQASHGSAPDIAGRDIANPTSLILSAAMLLEWLGRRRERRDLVAAADALTRAVEATLAVPGQVTRDIGGRLGTRDFGAAVARALEARAPA